MYQTLWRLFLGLIVGLFAGAVAGRAAETASIVVAVQVRGKVEVQHGPAGATEAVKDGQQLAAADVVTTAPASSVVLVMENGSVVSLRENSRLKIATALQSEPAGEAPVAKGAEPQEPGASNSRFELEFGEMLARVRKLNPSSTFEVQTPVSVAAVRGTVFEVSYRVSQSGPAQYRLSTASGLVHVTPRGGELVKVGAGDQAEFSARIRGKRVRLQPVKLTKIAQPKHAQLEKEAQDMEGNATEVAKRAQAANGRAKEAAAAGKKKKAADPTPKK